MLREESWKGPKDILHDNTRKRSAPTKSPAKSVRSGARLGIQICVISIATPTTTTAAMGKKKTFLIETGDITDTTTIAHKIAQTPNSTA